MLPESEPAAGSVIAIDAYTAPQRSFCSGVATALMVALPRPAPGTDNIKPTSPQHICSMLITLAMFEPLRFGCGASLREGFGAAGAGAAPGLGLRSSSLSSTGTSCSCASYLREIGRIKLLATSCISFDRSDR